MSTSEDDDLLAWITEIEEAAATTDDQIEDRLRECLESAGYTMPDNESGPTLSSGSPALYPYPSARYVEPPRTFRHHTIRAGRRRSRRAGPAVD